MNPHRAVFRLVAVTWLLLSMLTAAYADWTKIETDTTFHLFLNGTNYSPNARCRGGQTAGGTHLNPLGYLDLVGEDSDTLSALGAQRPDNAEDPAAAMLYHYSSAEQNLTGNMYVDWYKAFDRESGPECQHGADIVAYYDYGASTESALGLTWIQLYYEEGGSVHRPGLTVDAPYSRHTPAYYPPGTGPWTPPNYTLKPGHNLTWSDGPEDPHPERENWAGGIDFYVYLAGFGTPTYDYEAMVWVREITLYDGFTWGYDGICAPEPSTFWMLALGITFIITRRVLVRSRRL